MDAYIQVIREAFLFFPIIAALLAVPYVLYNYHKFGSVLSLRVVIIYSFILYLLCAFFLVILPLPTRPEAAALTTPRVQRIPFHCMQDILREYRESGGGGLLALINNRAFLQVAFNVIGNDVTITMAAEAGQLELNAFEPIVFYCMFQSIDTMAYAVQTFVDNCVSGITANETRCRYLVENSVGVITAICPHVGYQKAADIAKQAIKTGESVRDLILKEGLLTEDELNEIMDPVNMTEPGISGKELLVKTTAKNA